ncbi:signal recognition particle 19 kDa protein [Galendromus occidentalis]|uniref:Signal recognition particle 19 kDa protein n=1 Tax=Galendromus occidentalis TaxID=34638 RepID=A0AAJ6VW81_9ACAR|nr:signal recognition particle 19 kDa protein [Galendromus occidentalis]
MADQQGNPVNVIQVGPFNPQRKHSEHERWIHVFPIYLNKNKTVAEGRRVPKEVAVEDPITREIVIALQQKGFDLFVEGYKVHPREVDKENVLMRSRVRVHFKDDNGKPINSEFPNKRKLFKMICEFISGLDYRQDPETFKQHKRALQAQVAPQVLQQQKFLERLEKSQVQGPGTSAASTKTTNANKKKGKKGRK